MSKVRSRHMNWRLDELRARNGDRQRRRIGSRMRTLQGTALLVSLAAGAVFTGLAARASQHTAHHVQPPPATARVDSAPLNLAQASEAPSQSLFAAGSNEGFSVAPAPRFAPVVVDTLTS